uniref:Methionine--tRNA ligase n=1 Tax=Lygus hesperus TaxID=30085 RepID=A0A0A9XSV0_LYGHE
MDAKVLGLVTVFISTIPLGALGYALTKDDLEKKLDDARSHLNKDIPGRILNVLIGNAEVYLNQAGPSSLAAQCIYAKSKWYLKMYYDPLMKGFIQYESLLINNFGDEINDANFSNPTAINQLYEEIVGVVNTLDKDLQIWKEYISFTDTIIEGKYKACLALK